MYNNLNVGSVANDFDQRDSNKFIWEASQHREKGMQHPKENFTSQKINFHEIMINKFCTEKVLDYLSPEESIELKTTSKFRNYALNSREILCEIIQSSVLAPFYDNKRQ